MYKVGVLIPSGDTVQVMWAHDYVRMMTWVAASRPDIELHQRVCTGSLIPKQRHTLLASVIGDESFTHALFLDTDHRFPKDLLERLLRHDVTMVGVNYTRRNAPFDPVTFAADLEPVYTTDDSKGLERVHATGFGCVLLRLADLRDLEKPYFTVGYNPDTEKFMGEDFYFCHKLAQKGIPVYVDHDLSREVTHMGRIELTTDHALRQLLHEQKEAPVIEVVHA
jgi:hypothetical protein